MAERNDEVTRLRTDLSVAPGRPEFAAAMGGYNREQVHKYIDEQRANADAMKRVFYEKMQELRDELDLVSEENKRLRAALDEMTPIAAAHRGGEAEGMDTRKLVEQVAGILKARHEAEIASRENRIKAVNRTLNDARDEATRLTTLLSGRDAQIEWLNRALSEKEAEYAQKLSAIAEREAELQSYEVAQNKKDAVLAEMQAILEERDAELASLRQAYEAALMEKEEELASLKQSYEVALVEKETELASLRQEYETALMEKDAKLAEKSAEYENTLVNMEAALSEHKLSCAGALAQRETALTSSLKSKEEESAALKDAIEKKNVVIAAVNAQLMELLGDMGDARASLAQANARIEALENELAGKRDLPSAETLALKEIKIADLSEKVERLEEAVAHDEQEKEKLNATLAEKEEELVKLRDAIDEIVRLKRKMDGEEDEDKTDAAVRREREVLRLLSPNLNGTNR